MSTPLLALVLCLSQVAVETSPPGASLLVGLTPVGAAPAAVPAVAGVEIVAHRPGFGPAHRRWDRAERGRWGPVLRPHWPDAGPFPRGAPRWLSEPCGRCAVGVAEHASPLMAETLALARALAEQVASNDGRLRRLERVYNESAGGLVETAERQQATGVARLTRARRWARGEFAAARLDGGLARQVGGAGAVDVLAPTDDPQALAELAALASALRWWLVAQRGVQTTVTHAHWQLSDDGSRLIEVTRLLLLDEKVGALRVRWALTDTERLLAGDNVPHQSEGAAADQLDVVLPRGALHCRGGACRLSGAQPADARAAVDGALDGSGLDVEVRALRPRFGAARARATLSVR
ncbi:MAG: hypothetical protein H6704_14830 [Myxococcales bacterium]|nr:hypothetical protein [Myxococcales bacterium]